MSADPVAVAVGDNARWCDLVCRAHGTATRMDTRLWSADRRSPPLYPDAVTIDPVITAAEVLDRIQPGPGASVKDAYAVLDLVGDGFSPLVDGEWIFCAPTDPRPAMPDGWSVVSASAERARWCEAHGSGEVLLIDAPGVVFLQRIDDDEVTGGAVLHLAEPDLAGLSNVFGTPDGWDDLLDAARVVCPGVPLVGWESGEDLLSAQDAGFVSVGPLRVWLHG